MVDANDSANRGGETGGIVGRGPGSFAVSGPMQFSNATALLEQGRTALAAAAQLADVTLDLQSVGRTDSAGLAVLLEWLAIARHASHRLKVVNPPANLLALARVSEVDRIILAAD